MADFLLQVEEIKWSIVSGLVHGDVVISVRNLGSSRHAGEFVKQNFGDIGSAGGHRAMAKAVVPVARFIEKFGTTAPKRIVEILDHLGHDFVGQPAPPDQAAATPITAGTSPPTRSAPR